MSTASPNLTWCNVRLGQDMNWWVEEISDSIHWDVDGLSIIDPRQMAHLLDLMDPLREYGLRTDLIEQAFYKFRIEKEISKGKIGLSRVNGGFSDDDEPFFALPDVIDEEKGPYADFLNHITALRVKLLNDLIEFEQKFTIEELEDTLREEQNNNFMEGRATHVFSEVCDILEYVPDGYTLDDDEPIDADDSEDDYGNDIPDLDEDEKIEEDETMKWDDDEDDFEEEESEEEEEEEVVMAKPKRGRPRK
tara:strand:- start:19242 stop:19988 length:747 start_codon:yes stop_codon:yes gene_type:complete